MWPYSAIEGHPIRSMQERERISKEAERAKQEESANAQRKKEAAAALMRSVIVINLTAAATRPEQMCKSRIRLPAI